MQKLAMALALALLLAAGCTAPAQGNYASDVTVKNAREVFGVKIANETSNAATGVNANPVVVFETAKGTFKAEIFEKEAPITAGNFLSLVKAGFYNNLTFHRVEPNFVVQGGDPKGDGTGGSGKTIPLEIKPGLKHVYGTLAMARSQNPNSASSQFYVVKGPASFLDGQYAVFGKVTDDAGMKVVEKIAVGDRMAKVYVEG